MTIEEAIHHALNQADEQLLEVVQVRVTPYAIKGALALVMLTPERARAWALIATPRGVEPDLGKTDRWREIVIHPDDWFEFLREVKAHHLPGRVFGKRVVLDG